MGTRQDVRQLPGHPYVTYAVRRDGTGTLWITCWCSQCGDTWQKPCNYPRRIDGWVLRYGQQHGHGLRPVAGAAR